MATTIKIAPNADEIKREGAATKFYVNGNEMAH